MQCPKCGAEAAPGNQFCPKCGATMPAEAGQAPGGKVFCAKCGAEITGGAQFCPKCGAPSAPGASRPGSTLNLDPNVAGLLCYLGWWVTGLIFYLMEKENKFVRFHAVQSIATFVVAFVLVIVFQVLAAMFWPLYILDIPLWIASIVLWIILMMKAYKGEKFKLPIVGDFAEKNS
jgi:uncharacterized membrane protein